MLNLSNVTFTLSQLIGNVKLILLNARPTFEYANGVKTENILGTTYEVVTDGGNYDKFSIKVPDSDTAISNDDIRNSTEPLYVDFENTVCKIYTDNAGHIQVSVKADSIIVL